jgi:hypothetical protein
MAASPQICREILERNLVVDCNCCGGPQGQEGGSRWILGEVEMLT